MPTSYGQFCPVAKASEIFATRWTPLVLRELLAGEHSFNGIYRGVPLISRAVLVARLRELENHGLLERRPSRRGGGHEYWLTPAGEALRPVVYALGHWGWTHTRELIERDDLDPGLLLYGLCRRPDLSALPDRRIVLRFEFSGMPAKRTKFRLMWLVLERSGPQVCVKDPGFAVDVTLRGDIADFVAVYLGHEAWSKAAGKAISVDGAPHLAKQLPVWLQFAEGTPPNPG